MKTLDEDYKKEAVEKIIEELSKQINFYSCAVGTDSSSYENMANHLNIAKNFLKTKNNEWLISIKEFMEIPEGQPDEKKCAEFLQFLSQVAKRVAVETRDNRRKHLLTVTKGYFKLSKYMHLDKQLMFLYLLDSISDTEIDFLFSYYNKKKDFDFSNIDEDQFTMQEKLASVGLISKDIKNLQSSFRAMNTQTKTNFEKLVKELNKIRSGTESYYDISYEDRFNATRDSPSVVYAQSLLGLEFVSFLLADDSIFVNENEKRLKQAKENITNAVMKFNR